MKTTWTTIRTDRGLSAVHGGAALGTRTRSMCELPTLRATRVSTAAQATATAKRTNGVAPMSTFVVPVGPAYVTDQESHPPRGCPA